MTYKMVALSEASPVTVDWKGVHTAVAVLSIAAAFVLATDVFRLPRANTFLLVVAAMLLFVIAVGLGITGRAEGVLIDERNRISLSRLQLLCWTLLVVPALITAGLWNIVHGVGSLDIAIPQELWALLGISIASPVASQLAIRPPDGNRENITETQAGSAAHESPATASWLDLVRGEAETTASRVDPTRVQMLFFSLAVVSAYAFALLAMFGAQDPATNSPAAISAFPALSEGMVAIIGISHAGYLTRKTI